MDDECIYHVFRRMICSSSSPQNELTCSLLIEQVSSNGTILKKCVHKTSKVSLIRNQFRDILLLVQTPGKPNAKFNLRDFTMHKKFVKDGKATIKIPKQNLNFLLSNCPPDQLIVFLKTLTTKMTCQEVIGGFVPGRQRLLSDKATSVTDISPLNMKELQTVHNIRAKKAEAACSTPKSTGTAKRKRITHGKQDKENVQVD